jgi:hypothetical protein
LRISKEILKELQQLIRYDVTDYLKRYVNFIEFKAKNIINLYNGSITTFDKEAFNQLDDLYADSSTIQSLIDIHKEQLSSTTEHWDFLEMFTDIKTSLETLKNCQKWTRSSVDRSRITNGVVTEIVLSNRQNLEQLSRSIGASDKDNYWFRVALDNDLTEEDYTIEGGNILLVSGSNKAGVRLNSVIDTDIRGKKIYGKDFQRKIEFDSVENDLVVLDHEQTLHQTVLILSTLSRKDTPEFEDQGLQKSIFTGINRNSLPFPILVRQYYEIFSTDDSFKSILIKDIEIKQDSLSLTLECETKIKETISEVISIT